MKTTKNTTTRQSQNPQFAADVLNAAAHLLQTPKFVKLLSAQAQPSKVPERRAASARASGSGQRGRIAGFYFPRTKTIKNDSANVQNVFGAILKSKAAGITQKQIQDKLNLSHSTVWYSLQQLRAANAVTYRQPESKAAA